MRDARSIAGVSPENSLPFASKGSKKKLMPANRSQLSRARIAIVFAAVGAAGLYYAGVRSSAAGSQEIEHYQEALGFVRSLSSRAADLFDETAQRQLQDATLRLH